MTWVGQSEFQNSYSIDENFPLSGFTFAFVTYYFKKKPSKKNYKKYIFIYLYTFKSWNLVFIIIMLLLSQISSYIIHSFSTYSFFFFSTFLFHINFTTYSYTFSNFFPPFYLFIFLLLSTLILLFLYPFMFFYFWLYLIPLLLL